MLDTTSTTRMDICGWSARPSRSWSLLSDPEMRECERTIRGEVGFTSAIPVKHVTQSNAERAVFTARLEIKVGHELAFTEELDHEEAIIFGCKIGGCLFLEAPRHDNPLSASIVVGIPAGDFELLWEGLAGPAALELNATLIGVDYLHGATLTGDRASVKLESVKIRVATTVPMPSGWHEERLAAEFQNSLSDEILTGSRHSQMSKIAREFALSIANGSVTRDSRNGLAAHAREMMREARSIFRQPLNLTGETYASSWYWSPAEFVAGLQTLDEKEATKLKSQYDTIWKHFPIARVVSSGEESAGATAEGFVLDTAELEGLAANLLAHRQVSSPTLEWALLDSLIYAECIGFAQAILTKKKLFGMPIPTPLPGAAPFRNAGKALGSWMFAATGEAARIFATFLVASVVSQENAQTAWIVTTGVTVARWIRSAILWRERHPEYRQAELLAKMITIHDLFKTNDFNALAVRDQLYRVTHGGAVFSPWVFNILDARIRREAFALPTPLPTPGLRRP